MRLGLYVDASFRRDSSPGGGGVWSGDELFGFVSFAAAVGERLGGLVLIARATEEVDATPYELPAGVELAPLPHYRSLRDIPGLLRAMPATVTAMWRALARVDVVWVSASHPLGLVLMVLARMRRKRIVILVRQDTMRYFRSRLPSRRWAPLLLPLGAIDRLYRAVARRVPTTVVGDQIARRYRAPRENVLAMTVSLVREGDIPEEPPKRDWGKRVMLLTVGRVEPEKNPLLLAQALARLDRGQPGRFAALWAGEGRLAAELRGEAERLGVGEILALPGFVSFGPELLTLYREANVFVHISHTEGVPGVIGEAMACGLPIVATDVGGIRGAVEDGPAALLVPPDDADALADAVLRLDDDPALRRALAAAGLRLARERSLEAEATRVAAFIGGT